MATVLAASPLLSQLSRAPLRGVTGLMDEDLKDLLLAGGPHHPV